jgi:DNA-binding NarL/FixJ family response regulator
MTSLITERLQLLRDHHVAALAEQRRVVLVARCCGCKPREIAAALHRSEGAVQYDLNLAYATILDALGLERDVALLTWWVIEHRSCCLPDAFAFIENLGRFIG